LLSVFLVLKGWALIGDAMSHAMSWHSSMPGL
ncbi:TPA: metal ABC transporter permease, partial [Escherichia coli]|nr:metal ABC transporter permease [Escherichia coli]